MLIDGREALDRSAMATAAGVSPAAVTAWMHNARANGFPRRHRIGRKDWVIAEEFHAWLTQWNDRHAIGDRKPPKGAHQPDDLLKPSECAQLIGVTAETFRFYIKHARPDWDAGRPALLPPPDDVEILPSGRVRRRWTYRTIHHWHTKDRPGRGGRPAGTGHPTGSSGQEHVAERLRTAIARRQPLSPTAIAEELGITPRAAQRLIRLTAPDIIAETRLLSRTDIARRLPGDINAAKERVKWHMRQPGAPEPVTEIGNMLLYDPGDAETFIARIS